MAPTLHRTTSDTPRLTRVRAISLVSAAPSLWRVLDSAGRVIGHLEQLGEGADARYRARRFHPASRGFFDLGEFWSADDAVECLIFSR